MTQDDITATENRLTVLAELGAENARLRDAIEWACECTPADYAQGLRARAFPPKMETVEVTVWAVIAPSGFVETTSVNEILQREQVANIHSPFHGYRVVELKGIDQRPIPAKVKRREELEWCSEYSAYVIKSTGEPTRPPHSKLFAEWEE